MGDTNFTNIVTTGDATIGGNAVIAGSLSASSVITQSGYLNVNVLRAAPTAATTATPALRVNNKSVAANDAIVAELIGTPVFKVGNGGDIAAYGVISATGLLTGNGGALILGPTPATTATPAAIVRNYGAANDALVVSKVTAGTPSPVFKVGNSGTITGYVLRYASSGKAEVCGTTTITGTGTLATGLSTPQAVVALNMGADANYDHNRLSFTNTSATVVAKVWNGAATPAAAATGVPVDWCVIGTP